MRHRRSSVALALCVYLVTLAPCARTAAPAAAPADARFQSIYQQEWKWRIAQRLADDEDLPKGTRPELPHVDAAT
jgi:hypothetical protein